MNQNSEHAEAERAVAGFRNRVLPLLFAGYVLNFLDRTNISYAQLQMGADLGISLAAYGFGAGLFFVGYAGSCVPANLALKRFGVRPWLAFVFVAWGLVSCLMATLQGEKSFYVLRFLLGVIEGGFIPAVNFYFASWIPPRFRSRINAVFITAIPLAMIFGGPLAGALLRIDAWMPGWRWLFLIEGLPTVVLGLIVLRFLPATPHDAHWLTEQQRRSLQEVMSEETAEASSSSGARASEFAVFREPLLWGQLVALLIAYAATFALAYFLPTILKHLYHITPLQIGMLLIIPNVVALTFSYLIGRSSERWGDIRWHLAAVCLIGSVGFFLLPTAAEVSLGGFIAAVSIITGYTIAYYGPLNTSIQNTIGAHAGPLALVTTIGSIGGFFGPTLTGWVMQATGGQWDIAARVFAIATLASAGLAIVCVRNRHTAVKNLARSRA
ncbi:MFS transporter [Caballeronia zhejiangensis]|uniref:Membrane protein n=1 Tax=Caballeronia zhejiangensis TaxID=871203 RepID=A0A656QCU9_9BURK|nr:MFS transporter [Caballeronia zhejiangensis]KDR27157.1 membrane protein [Caballeronia zhejiangensis]BBQ03305.1 MFS transporter [Burkholderia sp. SFA1]